MDGKKTALIAIAVAFTLAGFEKACAYVDPGTGSMLLQWLVACVIGAFFTIKLYWRRIVNRFWGKEGRPKDGKD